MTDRRDPFESAVHGWCRAHDLAPAGARVVVACSGGPDSTALLFAMAALATTERWRLVVAHLDHSLREDSASDAAFARAQAARLNLPFVTARADVTASVAWATTSREDAARRARRSFLTRTASRCGAACVALGHTADDQAETAVLNAARGSGTRGLGAMPPALGLFVRPLLSVWRADVMAYLRRRALAYRVDATNRDFSFKRNWVRAELLPALEGVLPGVRERWWALAAASRRRETAAEKEAAVVTRRASAAPFPDGAIIHEGSLDALPAAARGRVVRQLYAGLTGSLAALERKHVDAVMGLAPGGAVALPRGIHVRREGAGLRFRKSRPGPVLLDWEVGLNVPGRTALPLFEWELSATLETAPDDLAGRGLWEVWLDAGKCASMTVRTRRPGDRISPAGLAGTRKLQDVFVDAKIGRARRAPWPIVCVGRRPAWVPGLTLAAGTSATPGALALHLVSHGLRAWKPERAERDGHDVPG